MTILHVTDFHFNKRWFDWLLDAAPRHDLTVMSGDMLDLASATAHRKQIAWVADWLSTYPSPLCIASGNHDLEWHDETARWLPAYWLRRIESANVWFDGQRVMLNGTSVLNIGCTTLPKGGDAEVWVVHAGPTRMLVTARGTGGDGGDPDLTAALNRYAPRLVLSGHVHDPLHWRQRVGDTLFLNPGRNAQAGFPNHILVRTEDLNCQFISARSEDSPDIGFLDTAPGSGDLVAAVAASA